MSYTTKQPIYSFTDPGYNANTEVRINTTKLYAPTKGYGRGHRLANRFRKRVLHRALRRLARSLSD